MSPRLGGKLQAANGNDAARRLAVGSKYFELAELMVEETDVYAITVAIGVSVLAGVAASDAACISSTGQYWRGQDHARAVQHLGTIRGSDAAARALHELLALKDQSHYGFGDLTMAKARTALKSARILLAFARSLPPRRPISGARATRR